MADRLLGLHAVISYIKGHYFSDVVSSFYNGM